MYKNIRENNIKWRLINIRIRTIVKQNCNTYSNVIKPTHVT